MIRARATLVAIGVLVAGCAGSNAAHPTTTSTTAAESTSTQPTTTTTIATTTTISQLDAAKQEYFPASSTMNTAIDGIEAKYRTANGVALRDYPAYCGEYAAVREAFSSELKNYTSWPTDAQDEIDALVTADAGLAGLDYACSHLAPTDSGGLQDSARRIGDAETTAGEAASSARLALGLPIDRG